MTGAMDKPGSDGVVPLNLYRVSRPGMARVISSERLTPATHEDVRHITLSLAGLGYRFLEGQSMGILPPGTDERGRAHKLRLYSFASSRLGDDRSGTTASLCVKRVVVPDRNTGGVYHGVASNYLCDARAGDAVSITGPAGKTLLLPPDPASNLILLATGTGIAPFRGFLRRIYEELPGWSGQVRLFFGARTRAECLYRDELESYRSRPGYDVVYALSREERAGSGERMYVHHRLAERMDDAWALLGLEDTYLYICGIKGMEEGIERVLADRARAEGVNWELMHEALSDQGRFLVETY
jgi:ferredoxin--NADP+ reductase